MAGYQVNFTLYHNKFTPVYLILFKMILILDPNFT